MSNFTILQQSLQGSWLTRDDINGALYSGTILTSEALLALEVLDQTGDSHAHFGANGGFIFTSNKDCKLRII